MISKKNIIIFSLLVASLMLMSNAFYIKAKAMVADVIIANTWESRETKNNPKKPWPWADTQVVASIKVPRLKVEQYVMQDASGESLAFGPGAVLPINKGGYQFIAGHRDTHFSYLDKLVIGDVVEIETHEGIKSTYKIIQTDIVDTRLGDLSIDEQSDGLSLMTCWPMSTIVPGRPLRYVVSGELI